MKSYFFKFRNFSSHLIDIYFVVDQIILMITYPQRGEKTPGQIIAREKKHGLYL